MIPILQLRKEILNKVLKLYQQSKQGVRGKVQLVRYFSLHIADPSLIPGTPYGPLSTSTDK